MALSADKPVLLLPVYKGGDFFKHCYSTVVGHQAEFERIVVSFNGSAADRIQDRKILETLGPLPPNVQILETPQEFTSFEHHSWMMSALASQFNSQQMIMNLFHDDGLLRCPNPIELELESVWVGKWSIMQKQEVVGALKCERVRPQNWIESFGFHGIFTNGSGMIAPLQVMRDVSRWMKFWKTGVRYEYLICTHKDIDSLKQSTSPLVSIRIHEDQEGANVKLWGYVKGELMFQTWLVAQGRIRNFKSLAALIFLFAALTKGALQKSLRIVGHSLGSLRRP